MPSLTPEDIDAILPQTQCGLCGYGGCMPYAEALIYEHAPINLCPPGGVKTLTAIATLLHQDPSPHMTEMEQKAKPKQLAVIRESECIGCTKCIQACPVDAILGSAKLMHTIIQDECTGCELCVPPCPVDCIDIIEIDDDLSEEEHTNKSNQYRTRFQARETRLKKEKGATQSQRQPDSIMTRKSYIQDAINRAKTKKSQQK